MATRSQAVLREAVAGLLRVIDGQVSDTDARTDIRFAREAAGLAVTHDLDGYVEETDTVTGDALVLAAIDALGLGASAETSHDHPEKDLIVFALNAVGFYAVANDVRADRLSVAEAISYLRRDAPGRQEANRVAVLALADSLEALA
jgi:hypothetical protein